MATYEAAVQRRSISRREHCAANESDLSGIGRAPGQQVRIWRSKSCVALYTVEARSTESPGTIGMGRAGRQRLQEPEPFDALVDSDVVDQRRTDEDAAERGEFVERITSGRGRRLAVIAPHGGDIERCTDKQAYRVEFALRAVRPWVWVCKGWSFEGHKAFGRWHITSTDISPESFPLLKRMLGKPFDRAISFHGFDRRSFPGADVRIGGLADDYLKVAVRDAIQDQMRVRGKPWEVIVENQDGPFSGIDPENIVNRLAPDSGGLQVEQSFRARDLMAEDIADAVASVYGPVFAAVNR